MPHTSPTVRMRRHSRGDWCVECPGEGIIEFTARGREVCVCSQGARARSLSLAEAMSLAESCSPGGGAEVRRAAEAQLSALQHALARDAQTVRALGPQGRFLRPALSGMAGILSPGTQHEHEMLVRRLADALARTPRG